MTTVFYVCYCGLFVSRQFRAGAQRFAKVKGWNLRVIPCEEAHRLDKLIEFWEPAGCILEDSADDSERYLVDSKRLPVVALDGTGLPASRNRFRVLHDSQSDDEARAALLRSAYGDQPRFDQLPQDGRRPRAQGH